MEGGSPEHWEGALRGGGGGAGLRAGGEGALPQTQARGRTAPRLPGWPCPSPCTDRYFL